MTLWLVGMMGSGKSAAGVLAAERLGIPFIDTDHVVEDSTGMSVAELWAQKGETKFREHERHAVEKVSDFGGLIATGGGVVLDPGNRQVMRETGRVIWLQSSPSVLARRLENVSDRPAINQSVLDREVFLKDLLEEREDLYRDASDTVIDTTDVDVDAVASVIEAIWNG